MHYQIHFTLDEARRLIPLVMPKVKKIVELKQILNDMSYDVYRHEYFGGIGPNGRKSHPDELQELIDIVKELEEKGIVVKGFDEGLLDFPHFRKNGEEVYLCWKLGEPTIDYWHRIPDGFAGRRPNNEL